MSQCCDIYETRILRWSFLSSSSQLVGKIVLHKVANFAFSSHSIRWHLNREWIAAHCENGCNAMQKATDPISFWNSPMTQTGEINISPHHQHMTSSFRDSFVSAAVTPSRSPPWDRPWPHSIQPPPLCSLNWNSKTMWLTHPSFYEAVSQTSEQLIILRSSYY